jgi:TRAP-type transport system small permease protein
MTRLWRLLAGVCRLLALGALAATVILPAIQIVSRGTFDRPIFGIEEASAYALICITFLALPLVVARDELIRLAEVTALLPALLRRAIALLIALLGLVAFAWVAWSGFRSGLQNLGTRTIALKMPYWLFVAPVVLGMAIAAWACLMILLGRLRPDPPETPASPAASAARRDGI